MEEISKEKKQVNIITVRSAIHSYLTIKWISMRSWLGEVNSSAFNQANEAGYLAANNMVCHHPKTP